MVNKETRELRETKVRLVTTESPPRENLVSMVSMVSTDRRASREMKDQKDLRDFKVTKSQFKT